MASIQTINRTKSKAYRVQIRRKGLKPISKVFNTKQLAINFAKRVESDNQLLQAFGQTYSKLTFKEVVSLYFDKSYTGKRPKEQRWKLDYWCSFIGEKKIAEINKGDIVSGICELPKHYENSTINRFRAAVSGVFAFACKELDLPENPVRYAPSLPENNGRTRFLSEAERTRLFKACRASHWDKLYLIVLLAITTGARKGELTKLRWNDIDFDRRTAYVSTTKNGQPKVLPLTDSVIKELQLFDTKDSSLIFASRIKEDVAYCFTKPWKKALEDAEIEDFRFHDLRHSCASYLAQSGASLLEIADVLGHKDISVTKRYAHLCIEHRASLINRVLGGI